MCKNFGAEISIFEVKIRLGSLNLRIILFFFTKLYGVFKVWHKIILTIKMGLLRVIWCACEVCTQNHILLPIWDYFRNLNFGKSH